MGCVGRGEGIRHHYLSANVVFGSSSFAAEALCVLRRESKVEDERQAPRCSFLPSEAVALQRHKQHERPRMVRRSFQCLIMIPPTSD